ncbi:MAG TPA: B12-binding domain-containing radical SAM protein [Nanoarchaeota archaeon]|nr:B12-binding domain-containing radical SAM protein [Nanoarchaeota archaeon]HIH63877.1 B12-binding domain-containing radical SAM protein [Nanoarchaeota archaeon]HIJ09776.1 B12-binding domain-containing radical SAM protein [Nanoarchaeota archaeon]
MKKIALINPPSPFLINDKVFPNSGLLQLTTSLKEKGYNARIIDLCGNENPLKKMFNEIQDETHIGFSSTTPQFVDTYKLHKELKKKIPKIKTIIGGAHPSAIYSLMKNGRTEDVNIKPLMEFDHIVVGEGDEIDPFNLQKGWNVQKLIKDINEKPIPDRKLIDILSYEYSLKGKSTTTIVTQRGCPFKCTFCCGRDIEMYKIPRSKSPEKILEELDYLNKNFGFESFMWYDDEVNVNPKRLMKISELLKDRNYQHRGFIRSDLLVKHPETLEALVKAGFVELCSGVESGSERILKMTNKGTTPEINSQAAKMIMDAGLTYKAFTIIGHPSETYKDIEKTIDWLKENKPNNFDVTIMTPYPGSTIYNHSQPSTKYDGYTREWNGLYFNNINFSSQRSVAKGKPGEYSCEVRTDELTSNDLIRIREEMDKELR